MITMKFLMIQQYIMMVTSLKANSSILVIDNLVLIYTSERGKVEIFFSILT